MTDPATPTDSSLVGLKLSDEQLRLVEPFLNKGMGEYLGLRYVAVGPDRVEATWKVDETQHQPAGLVHGGVYCAVIEGLCSIAGTWWLGGKGTVVGVNNNTDFLRAACDGTLRGVATPVYRGRTQQLWETVITDEEDRLIARGQVRLANLVAESGKRH